MKFDEKKALQIWLTIAKVPKGKVASYGQIADLAGLPGRARLVGRVLAFTPKNRNVAWYRIIRSSGQLAFNAGSDQADLQKKLLEKELVTVINNRVKMNQFRWNPTLSEILNMTY